MEEDTQNGVHLKPRRRRSLWKVLLRIPVALYGLVVIIYLAMYASRWNGEPDPWGGGNKRANDQVGLGIGAAVVPLIASSWDLVAYVTRSSAFPFALDFAVIPLGVFGWIQLAFSSYRGYQRGENPPPVRPWTNDEAVAGILVLVLWIVQLLLCIMACCDCCCGRWTEANAPPKRPSAELVRQAANEVDNGPRIVRDHEMGSQDVLPEYTPDLQQGSDALQSHGQDALHQQPDAHDMPPKYTP